MTARARSGRPMGNLPGEVTSFVGRRRETVRAVRLMRTARLLTLTGVAGVGKTRLALRVAAQVREAFPHGVWLVELAALTDGNLLPQTLADVLDIRDQLHAPTVGMLADHLADKRLLLVLDNCEHLVDVCAMLVSELLAAPGLQVLATSRHSLGAVGEQLLEVPPLSVPDPDQPMTTRTVARHEAVQLFAERAAVAQPGFALNAGNRATVVRICQRLDGIPLAIELVALRVRAMPVTEILTRLDDYLEFLTTGSLIAVPRLQPLRAAIDWSFALCSPLEQQLWARASVFAGEFDLEAAEAVCSGQGITREDVFDLVAALVDKSVLIRIHDDADTLARYRMLEAIRHYGQEQLASSHHLTAVRLRHRDHYRHLVTRSEQEWLGPNELTWFTRLRREHANLRIALAFCLTQPGQPRVGLEITAALWHYWIRSCTHTEGRYWLDQTLQLDPEPSTHRAKALGVDGWLALMQADMATARSLLEQSRELAHWLGDELALARTTLGFGVAAFNQNDLPNAITLLQDAFALHQALNDPTGVWLALLYLAVTAAGLGDTDRAIAFSEECLALCDTRNAYPSRIYACRGSASVGGCPATSRQPAG
ncbi:LuxR family transcriptional regulator [Kibdelosporangium aridum]|uniref:LuxR family transcriptional regulator n=1 Tax=Kibdelosporangium aridum TaxID=2030 RepID=A0A428YKC0_KIBAR|nr:AAA family ATPase [Kibdelosporangium aridum]RSM67911.1 LuxR family transcriptional regulator [Kibdelosporangium aridum]